MLIPFVVSVGRMLLKMKLSILLMGEEIFKIGYNNLNIRNVFCQRKNKIDGSGA